VKARGLLHFVVLRGVLYWACGSFALLCVFMFFTGDWQRFVAHNTSQPGKTILILVSAGVLWGVFVWAWEDWLYRRHLAKSGAQDGNNGGAV
jgi:hypothetical protein